MPKSEALPAFAQAIVDTIDLPPEQAAILDEAVKAFRRVEQIRAALDKVVAADEMLIRGERGSLVASPLLAQERSARDAFVRCLRALNLPE